MPDHTVLIGSTEAARTIGIDKSTLSRWSQEGRIAVATRLPGKNGAVLFTSREVQRVAKIHAALLAPASPPEGAGE